MMETEEGAEEEEEGREYYIHVHVERQIKTPSVHLQQGLPFSWANQQHTARHLQQFSSVEAFQ